MPPEAFYDTWKIIADIIGRSERWCRMHSFGTDPLPVYKVGGIVRLNRIDLDAWLERRRVKGLKQPVATAIAAARDGASMV